jgi:hypothetical protein
MTESTHATATEVPDTEEVPDGISWPSLPSEPATQSSAAQNSLRQDPAVSSLLERLGALPGMSVSGHGEVFTGLENDLMEALNEDVTGHDNARGDLPS